MNERIQELYEQSRIGYGLGYDMEKFVELIVQEFVNVVKEHYDDTLPWGGVEDALEHFGDGE